MWEFNIARIKPSAMVAEFIGTFLLSFSVLISLSGFFTGFATPQVAGLVLATMTLILGKISGTHLNPAVTFSAWLMKKTDLSNTVAYILAQFSGALLSWVVLSLLLSGDPGQFSLAGNSWPIFFGEAIGSAMFGFGIAASIQQKFDGLTQAVVIGVALFLGISFASVASNGVINPAIAASSGSFSWSYLLAPLIGLFLGARTYFALFKK